MTTPERPLEPLSDNERDLARISRALPTGEPSALLDARILKAASNAIAGSSKRRVRWWASTGSAWGVGTAAAAVLAIGISWQMRHSNSPFLPTEIPTGMSEEKSEPSNASAEFKQETPPERDHAPSQALAAKTDDSFARDAQSETKEVTGHATAKTIVSPTTARATPSPFPEAAVEDRPTDVGSVEASPIIDTDLAATGTLGKDTAPPAKSMYSGASEARQEAGKKQNLGMAATSSVANEPAAPVALQSGERADQTLRMRKSEVAPSVMADFGDDPEQWVKRIRQLQQEGKLEEAQMRLSEFKKQFPDYVIPADLIALLQP